ncbi:MAG: potassium channel family protein [Deltaproteobacteria bacterium]
MDRTRSLFLRQVYFKRRFHILFVSLLAMILVTPLVQEFVGIHMVWNIFLSAILLSGVHAVSGKKRNVFIASFLALPMLVSVWSEYIVKNNYVVIVGTLCGVAFFAYMIVNILLFIYEQDKVTRDLIVGAAVVYLLMAMMWTFIYRLVETVHPGSFAISTTDIHERVRLTYFSLVTITTLGYGDIVPTTGLASSLATLEAVVGQLYLVTTVAWLVGVRVSQSRERKSE